MLALVGGIVAGCQSVSDACGGLGPVTCLMFGRLAPTQHETERVGFTPPRPVACYDHELIGLLEMPGHAQTWGAPAGHKRERYWGFSVLPPAGDNWCARRIVRPVPWQVVFAKNMYGAEVLSAPPPRRQRQHTLIAFVQVDEQDTPFDLASLRRRHATDCGFGCRMISADIRETDRFPAKCLSMDLVFEADRVAHQFMYYCIHPSDPRLLVRWGVEESYRAGAPFYSPPLMERLRPEYEVMLNSLEFTPVDFNKRSGVYEFH